MKIPGNAARLLTAIFSSAILVVFSCKKETSDTLSPQDEEQANVAATQSDTEAESVFDGVFNDVLGVNKDVALGGTGIFGRNIASNYGGSDLTGRIDNTSLLPSCLSITIEHTTTNTFPIRITLDFGTTGCTANDGHSRKGKIIITYSNRLLYPGASATANFQDFYLDSIHVDNSSAVKISNSGTQDKLQFKVDVDAKMAKSNGNYSEWHSSKTMTQIAGSLSTSPLDDVFTVSGGASGKIKRTDLIVAWDAKIDNPLVKKFGCHWISVGTVRIARQNLSANSQWYGLLDYGNGVCDMYAKLTVYGSGRTYQITLR